MSLGIGITCYPTVGGSGVVATEIGLELARRGHRVHFICAELPFRLDPAPGVRFHPVRAAHYPVFEHTPYALALTSALVDVARSERLDLLHVHYAVPHAISAWMARDVLGGAVRVVTTLHGTDVTVVGADPSYRAVTRHSVLRSDAITTPSAWLREEARHRLDLGDARIDVLPNFVDTEVWRPLDGPPTRLRALFPDDAPVIVHVSNFRPVKRVDRVVDAFARVAADRPARLLLVGDGPDRPAVEDRLRSIGLADRAVLIGTVDDLPALVRECAVLHLPSESESFGLAALEALASGVPVVASAVGGLPEVVRDGETGFLVAVDDVAGMALRIGQILDHPDLRATLGRAARADALTRFRTGPAVDGYEALYRRVVGETRDP